MSRREISLLQLILLALLPGCDVTVTLFRVPTAAVQGRTFEVVVQGNHANAQYLDSAGAVFQVPDGFEVLSGWMSQDPLKLVKDDPALLALYTAEPGHHLVAFSAKATELSSIPNPLTLRVLIRAPLDGGSYTLKVSGAGTTDNVWSIKSPAGVGNFAGIQAAPHVATMQVAAPFAPLSTSYGPVEAGLPAYDTRGWSGVDFADVDGDGRDDLAAIARLGDGPRFYRSNGVGFEESSNGLSYSFSGRSDVTFGDVDADGFLDIVDGNGRVFLGNGGGAWAAKSSGIVNVGNEKEGVAVGDIDNDGFDDFAFSGHFDGYVQCYRGVASGPFVEVSTGLPNQTIGSDGGHKLLMVDANGDGNDDIVWSRYYKPGVWLGNGAGVWTEVPNHGLGPHQMWGGDARDLDGDGDDDLAFGVLHLGPGSAGGGGIQIYEALGNGTYQLKQSTGLPSTGDYMDIAFADFDQDGLDDIVGAAQSLGPVGTGLVEVHQRTGAFTFGPMSSSGLPKFGIGSPEGIAVGDVNGDGYPDIGLAGYAMGVIVFENRAAFANYGQSCGPRFGVSGTPNIGSTTFSIGLESAHANSLAYLLLGVQPISAVVGGAGGCRLYTIPVLQLALPTGPAGDLDLILGVPFLPQLIGVPVYGQWAVSAPINPLGVAFSDGGAIRFTP